MMIQKGAVIQTTFGKGTLISGSVSRGTEVQGVDDDAVCVVELDFGFLYAPPRTLLVLEEEEDEDDEAAVSDKGKQNGNLNTDTKNMMDLEVAYHALEMMRKQNLQVDCSQQQHYHHEQECNNNNHVDLDRCCSACLLDHNNSKKQALLLPHKAPDILQSVMPCMQSFWEEQLVCHVNSFIQEQQIAQLQHIPRGNPCLSCGAPVCPLHTSKSLQLDNGGSLAVCLSCEPILNIDSVIEKLLSASSPTTANQSSRRSRVDERRAFVNRLVECYDRLLMRLQCFEPFLEDLASFLDNEGSRSEEDVGGWKNHNSSSTTQSTSGFLSVGLADWILASYHLLQSLLVVTGTAFTRAHILLTAKEDQDKEEEHDGNASQRGNNSAPWTSCPEHDPSGGNNLGMPSSNLGGAMTETALKYLSYATLSEKARTLRRLHEDLDVFPSTASITEGCQVFLSALAEHEHGLKVQAISTFLASLAELSYLEPTAGYFLEQQQQQSQEEVRGESSLYERIERYQKRRDSMAITSSRLSATTTAPDADTKAAVEQYLYNQRMKMYQLDRRERSSSTTSSSETDNIIVADPIIDDDDNGKYPRRESATSTTSITSVTSSSSSSLVWSNIAFNNKRLAGNKKARRNSLLHRISLHKQRQRASTASPSVQTPELEPQQQW